LRWPSHVLHLSGAGAMVVGLAPLQLFH
jgi:hypothetical protein